MVINVLVEIRKIDKTFSYLVPKNLEKNIEIGKRCIVPFGNKTLEGFIVGYNNEKLDYKLKEIISITDDNPVLNSELLELGSYISKKTLSTKINAYQTMLPTALKAKKDTIIKEKKVLFIRKIKDYNPISEKEKILYDLISINDISLKEANEISTYTVNKLIKNGIIEKYEKEVYRLNESIVIENDNKELTSEQKSVIDKVNLNNFKPYLLHGVTGSGKTEVYIQLIKKVIEKNRKAILLVPEISLTPQIVEKFKKRFGNVAILHSGLSNGEKYDEWRKIERGEVNIVIGARSAIFAPLSNIGIIIIDEEHSDTYKQENSPMYNAIDIALYRSKTHNCPLILGSATPSIESYTRANNGIYELLEMKNRVNNNMPKITLVDMKEEIKNKNRILSKILKDKIKDRLEKKEQIIILLNRRGYTTITTCSNCGYTHKCPKCDIPLTYHLKTSKMHCHYCNYETNKLYSCPVCKSTDINERGMGTEKLELEIKKEFENARVVRMDVDTTRNKNSHKKIINDFEEFKYDILVGTQMIAKGLDFPKVTLVGVINADSSLTIPDFRSAERTFQLLNQVSGRSGRSDLKGEVIIQAFNIEHYSLIYSKKNDYLSFYNKEMNIRKLLKYPPFYNLCLIKIQGADNKKCEIECEKIHTYLKDNINDIILGPSASVIPKINNIYYYQIIIKYKDTKKIYKHLKYINELYTSNNIKVTIDFNPTRI
ncbi:MAG: primosomal protein N' [Firmicutes bacterium]|nr:primosomal protein N' [Bacillota bacterium]